MSKENKPKSPVNIISEEAPRSSSQPFQEKPFGGVPEMMTTLNEQIKKEDAFMTYEPAIETVVLPSKGKFYDESINKVLKDSGGKIALRPLTFKEESMLTNPRIVKTGQLLNAVLSSTIKTPNVNVEYMLSTDRIFLFYYLRSISYGDKYTFEIECPECNKSFDHSVKLSQLNIKYAEDTDKEPIEVFLPKTGKKVGLRFSRGIDENASNEDEDLVGATMKLIVSIEDVPKIYWRRFCENLPVQDSAILRTALGGKEPGIQTNSKTTCIHCGHSFEISMPLTANFFRPE